MKAAFIFSGQGAQCVGMGKDLTENSPAAAAVFREADTVLDWSVSEVCFNGPAEKLTESQYCQPSIYTTSAACLAAFQEKYPGVNPVAAAGLSLGEYAALYCAGCFDFATGLRLLEQRARFMGEACAETAGTMASVLGGDPEVILEVCKECDIDVANYNCPGQIVISGVRDRVGKASEILKGKGVKRVIPLNVAGAFHSRLMKGAGEKLAGVLGGVEIAAPRIAVAQNYPGDLVSNGEEIRENLIRQVAGSVRWEECVRAMARKTGADTFIEFGPGSVLSGLVRKTDSTLRIFNVSCTADLEKITFED